jgi:hypothetical protein
MYKPAARLSALAQEANEAHAQAQAAIKTGVAHAERAGKALIRAKSNVEHGQWSGWLAQHFDGSERTAQIYMRLARKMPLLDDETRIAVADLSLREAVKKVSRPRMMNVTVLEKPIQFQPIRVTLDNPEPKSNPPRSSEHPPARVRPRPASVSPAPDCAKTGNLATRNVIAYQALPGAQTMLPHLAALVDYSRMQSPGDFALALASNQSVAAADLDRLVAWLSTSACELRRLATADGECAGGAVPLIDG